MSTFTYSNVVGTFQYNATDAPITINFTGTLYRCIPHRSQTPLSANFAFNTGARWNCAGSYPVLYTFASVQVARSFADSKASYGFSWDEIPTEQQLDLVVLQYTGTLVDVATNAGLQCWELPITYPVGYQTADAYPITQAIGQTIYDQQFPGLVARSATAAAWDGPITEWGEVALFSDNTAPPILVDRLTFSEWYICD